MAPSIATVSPPDRTVANPARRARQSHRCAHAQELPSTSRRREFTGVESCWACRAYLIANRPWSIYIEQHEIGGDVRRLLSRWKGDGVITRQITQESVKLVKRRNLAAVDLSNFLPHLGVPRINSGDLTIGRMAAEHFLERGFKNFACCEYLGQHWSQQRRIGFVAEVEFAGGKCAVYEQPFRTQAELWDKDQERFAAWLIGLPKPVGILATNDLLGHHVLDAWRVRSCWFPSRLLSLGWTMTNCCAG